MFKFLGGDVVADEGEKIDKRFREADGTFFIKMPDSPQVGSAEAGKTEQQLLAAFRNRGPKTDTLKPLAIFYSRVGQQEKAYQYLKVWMKYARGKDEMAECLLMSGQIAEQMHQPRPAITFYREGLRHQPENPKLLYFLNNNLAYCLIMEKEYDEAVKHCQQAITVDATRAHAFKNLGLALEGLGRYGEAARDWMKAVHIDASDRRSLDLLEKLVSEQREAVAAVIPDLDKELESCRHAVATAQVGRFHDWAKGLPLN